MSTKKVNNIDLGNNKTVAKVDKNSEKYKLALKLVNMILVNIGKTEIDDLTKFVDIDRKDIIKDINKIEFEKMTNEIFKQYDKKQCGYYRKTDTFILNCLRCMLKDIGFNFEKQQKDITSTINGDNYRKTHTFYSIKLSQK